MSSCITLVASLPKLPHRFDAGPSPITGPSLRSRISMLPNDEQRVVRQLSDFFRWDRQPRDRTDAEVRATHQRLLAEIRNPFVAEMVRHRFEMRTIVAALRCQREGLPQPELPELSLSVWIRRHWDRPNFQLETRFEWLPRFCKALDEHKPRQAQWELFDELWNTWTRLDEKFQFSFESFVLYLARWEILDRWSSQDAERGRERFDQLVDKIVA